MSDREEMQLHQGHTVKSVDLEAVDTWVWWSKYIQTQSVAA